MVAKIIKSGRSGWYFRVLEIGEIEAGSILERTQIGEADWSVERTFNALIAGQASKEELVELGAMKPLAPKLRDKATAKLAAVN